MSYLPCDLLLWIEFTCGIHLWEEKCRRVEVLWQMRYQQVHCIVSARALGDPNVYSSTTRNVFAEHCWYGHNVAGLPACHWQLNGRLRMLKKKTETDRDKHSAIETRETRTQGSLAKTVTPHPLPTQQRSHARPQHSVCCRHPRPHTDKHMTAGMRMDCRCT